MPWTALRHGGGHNGDLPKVQVDEKGDANVKLNVPQIGIRGRARVERVIGQWLNRYDTEQPHSALGYLTPKAYREQLAA